MLKNEEITALASLIHRKLQQKEQNNVRKVALTMRKERIKLQTAISKIPKDIKEYVGLHKEKDAPERIIFIKANEKYRKDPNTKQIPTLSDIADTITVINGATRDLNIETSNRLIVRLIVMRSCYAFKLRPSDIIYNF